MNNNAYLKLTTIIILIFVNFTRAESMQKNIGVFIILNSDNCSHCNKSYSAVSNYLKQQNIDESDFTYFVSDRYSDAIQSLESENITIKEPNIFIGNYKNILKKVWGIDYDGKSAIVVAQKGDDVLIIDNLSPKDDVDNFINFVSENKLTSYSNIKPISDLYSEFRCSLNDTNPSISDFIVLAEDSCWISSITNLYIVNSKYFLTTKDKMLVYNQDGTISESFSLDYAVYENLTFEAPFNPLDNKNSYDILRGDCFNSYSSIINNEKTIMLMPVKFRYKTIYNGMEAVGSFVNNFRFELINGKWNTYKFPYERNVINPLNYCELENLSYLPLYYTDKGCIMELDRNTNKFKDILENPQQLRAFNYSLLSGLASNDGNVYATFSYLPYIYDAKNNCVLFDTGLFDNTMFLTKAQIINNQSSDYNRQISNLEKEYIKGKITKLDIVADNYCVQAIVGNKRILAIFNNQGSFLKKYDITKNDDEFVVCKVLDFGKIAIVFKNNGKYCIQEVDI